MQNEVVRKKRKMQTRQQSRHAEALIICICAIVVLNEEIPIKLLSLVGASFTRSEHAFPKLLCSDLGLFGADIPHFEGHIASGRYGEFIAPPVLWD